MSPDQLLAAPIEWVLHYTVVLVRLVGLFLFLPIFGSEIVPLRLRMGIAAVLAFAFAPLVPPVQISLTEPVDWVLIMTRELAVGFGLGLAAHATFAGIEMAAGLIAGQSGFALASMIDPTSGDQGLAPTLFHNLLSISLFLAADLHHLFLHAVVASYEALPPAASLVALGSLDQVTTDLGLRMFTVAIELAAPALVVTVAVDLVMALVGRAMPQVPVMLVGYPLKLVAGLVAMVLLAQVTGSALGWLGRTISSDTAMVIAALRAR